jgi:hypothetical protein
VPEPGTAVSDGLIPLKQIREFSNESSFSFSIQVRPRTLDRRTEHPGYGDNFVYSRMDSTVSRGTGFKVGRTVDEEVYFSDISHYDRLVSDGSFNGMVFQVCSASAIQVERFAMKLPKPSARRTQRSWQGDVHLSSGSDADPHPVFPSDIRIQSIYSLLGWDRAAARATSNPEIFGGSTRM